MVTFGQILEHLYSQGEMVEAMKQVHPIDHEHIAALSGMDPQVLDWLLQGAHLTEKLSVKQANSFTTGLVAHDLFCSD